MSWNLIVILCSCVMLVDGNYRYRRRTEVWGSWPSTLTSSFSAVPEEIDVYGNSAEGTYLTYREQRRLASSPAPSEASNYENDIDYESREKKLRRISTGVSRNEDGFSYRGVRRQRGVRISSGLDSNVYRNDIRKEFNSERKLVNSRNNRRRYSSGSSEHGVYDDVGSERKWANSRNNRRRYSSGSSEHGFYDDVGSERKWANRLGYDNDPVETVRE